MAQTKAGKGCGSCKGLVAQIVEWAAGGQVEDDPLSRWYVPGVPLEKPALMAAVREQQLKSVSSVFAALAPGGKEDATSKPALANLLHMMWNDEYEDERDARFVNDRVHGNIQRDGTFSVVPQMKGGVTNPDQLRRIADVADKYDIPLVKLTGGQRIDLLGVRKEDLPAVWADLDMPSGYAYGKSFRTVKTCVGSDFCRFGVGDSTGLGIALEERFQGIPSPGKMKLAVAGVPATARRRSARTSWSSPSTAAGGRSTSAGRPAPTCARGTCSRRWTAPRRSWLSPVASCSTTARTRTGSSAPTTSCPEWASSTCGRCCWPTPTGWSRGSTSACRPPSTPTGTRGARAAIRPRSASSRPPCR